jgi:hypothetical protein
MVNIVTPSTTTLSDGRPVVEQPAQKVYEKKKTIFRTYQIVWYILGVIEVLLAFRFILKMLGASTRSLFTSIIYALSAPFALPFLGMFGATSEGRYVIEWTTLVGMIFYVILAYGIIKVFQIVKPTDPEEVESTVDSQ